MLLLFAMGAASQRFGGRHEVDSKPVLPDSAEFHFIRLEYTDLPQYQRRFGFSSRSGRGSGWWMMDWPDAEEHFSLGIQRLTRIHTGRARHLRLTDENLFDHPWIYATQVGWWGLSEAEIARLREYLMRGGFLVVDDFWGPEQWSVFRETMERVLPDSLISDIPDADSAMHVLYDIPEKDRIFIAGTRHLWRGGGGTFVAEQPYGTVPTWRAIRDERDRMVVAINFNMDVADAWEYADWPEYPAAMTTLAYRLGINYIIYAMTH
jgi:hypothetical protein